MRHADRHDQQQGQRRLDGPGGVRGKHVHREVRHLQVVHVKLTFGFVVTDAPDMKATGFVPGEPF